MNQAMRTNLEIVWVAVGIALTNAAQLRPTSLPIGPGEVILSIWMLRVGIGIAILRHHLIMPITRVIFWFWIISFICLTIGFSIAESENLTSNDAFHDLLAFVFVSSFSVAFLIWLPANKDFKKLLLVYLSFIIFSLFIIFYLPFLVPFLDPWLDGVRFMGWSTDPNQLSILLSPIPFLSLHLFTLSNNILEKSWYIFLILMTFVLGIATQSDSLRLGWTIAILVALFLGIYRGVSKGMVSYFRPDKKFVIKQLLLLSLFLIILFLGYVVYEQVYAVMSDLYNYGSQGGDRLTLWGNAIAALFHSPLFGLGPGAHSGYAQPFLDFEAHNTFIDWAASYGIIGLICYLSLLGWVGWKAWKSGSSILVAALISLVGYSVFVYVARHIVFWFSLLAIANLSAPSLNQKPTNRENSIYLK
jgi:O-antigen ligase